MNFKKIWCPLPKEKVKQKILFKFFDLEEEKPCTIIPNIYDNKSEQSKIKKYL